MTLAYLIDQFAKLHPELAEQKQAFSMCDFMSGEFIRFAQGCGYEGDLSLYTFDARDITEKVRGGICDKLNPDPVAYDVMMPDPKSPWDTRINESGQLMCSWHCVVDAGHILIDFTARQYSMKLAYPHIIAIEHNLTMAAKAGA